MTDNDIIKALEIHADNEADCSGCPIYHSDTGETCVYELSQNALSLINRQKAENEALINGQETLQKYIAEQKAEIERLERTIEDLESIQEISPEAKYLVDTKADKVISLMNEILKSQEQIKAEAITEFEDRLNGAKFKQGYVYVICADDVSKIAKKMKEGVGE